MRTTILGVFLILCAVVGFLNKLIEATEASGLIATGIGFILTKDQKKSSKRIGGGNAGTTK